MPNKMNARLRQWVDDATNVVVFTGAGISTDSNIPDFRSPGGLWTRMKPIMFQDFLASEEMQIESWRRKFALDEEIGAAKPNGGHRAIAHLVKKSKVSHVITQNIDNLHQASGVAHQQVIELHGNGSFAKCLDCGLRHELVDLRRAFEAQDGKNTLRCQNCGGLVKSATISFGQSMPDDEMRRAETATLACDLFIVIGSSLQVYPAAGFPILASRNGAKLVIINREPTDLDEMADLVINEEITPVLIDLVGLNS